MRPLFLLLYHNHIIKVYECQGLYIHKNERFPLEAVTVVIGLLSRNDNAVVTVVAAVHNIGFTGHGIGV